LLNELAELLAGVEDAGLPILNSHPDFHEVGKGTILRVRLDDNGKVDSVALIPEEAKPPWTLRTGQHNSFPCMKTNSPVFYVPSLHKSNENKKIVIGDKEAREIAEIWKRLPNDQKRREKLHELRDEAELAKWITHWPSHVLREKNSERLKALNGLHGGPSAAVPAVIERFEKACSSPEGLFASITDKLRQEIDEGDNSWLNIAWEVLIKGAGKLYFDVPESEFPKNVSDTLRHQEAICSALMSSTNSTKGLCGIRGGGKTAIISGNFPQPKLPGLGQAYIFSKNKDIPAASRYGKIAADGFPLGIETAGHLADAIKLLTAPDREKRTWRKIPGEQPKKADLLVAFMPAVPGAEWTEVLAAEEEDDDETVEQGDAFEYRTRRVIETLEGKVGTEHRNDPVHTIVLRKVDQANAKIICHRTTTAKKLLESARAWQDGISNLPPWSVLLAIEELHRQPHVTPLQMPGLTRRKYIRGGREFTKAIGLSPANALTMFLGYGETRACALSTLRLIMDRYGELFSNAPRILRNGIRNASSADKKISVKEALRAVSAIGVMLYKLNRYKEGYMNETAFQLGQLLAVADTVHIGYCRSVRAKDKLPPTLLGNALLPIAASSPFKALSMMCQRWKPYGSWAKRTKMPDGKEDSDVKIRQALSQAYRVSELCRGLHVSLTADATADDIFRAELLLGYMAGLDRKADKQSDETEDKGD